MSIEYRAAVLHAVRAPMQIETVAASPLSGNDVLVRIKAAGLCHTDLEVMTGVGAALNIAEIGYGDTVMVIGCGAVGLAAVQGARLAGAGAIVAVDLEDKKLDLAEKVGATDRVNPRSEDVGAIAKAKTGGRGVDVVLEAAGQPASFRASVEAVRPGGQVVWPGKPDIGR